MQGRVETLKSKRPAVTGLRACWVEMTDIFLDGELNYRVAVHLFIYLFTFETESL